MVVLAKENSGYVYAYNDAFQQVLKEQGQLYQYTDRTIAISRKGCIYIYNDHGELIATYPKDFVDTSNITGVIM
jgi:hypothetical protein